MENLHKYLIKTLLEVGQLLLFLMKSTSRKLINELNSIYEKNKMEITDFILNDKNLIFVNNDDTISLIDNVADTF